MGKHMEKRSTMPGNSKHEVKLANVMVSPRKSVQNNQ